MPARTVTMPAMRDHVIASASRTTLRITVTTGSSMPSIAVRVAASVRSAISTRNDAVDAVHADVMIAASAGGASGASAACVAATAIQYTAAELNWITASIITGGTSRTTRRWMTR